MTDIVDQPPPVASNHRPAWELVIEDADALRLQWPLVVASHDQINVLDLVLVDMRERDRLGRERYGVPLQAGNGRNHLVDGYQENLDLIVYLRAWLDERPHTDIDGIEDLGYASSVQVLYHDAIRHALVLRYLIERGL